jgi:membrane protein implicated in regulation of membrane protease activity
MVDAWMIWIGIGILCMIIEIFTPGFFFMSIGLGALLTGLVSLILPGTALQILCFAVITFIIFLFTRKLSRKIMSKASEETNIYALKGMIGKVVKEIPEDGRGYVKVEGEEWSAKSFENKIIKTGSKVEIIKVDGNKLLVKEIIGEE